MWEVFFTDDTFNKQLQNELWAIYWQISDIGLHCHVSQGDDSVYIYICVCVLTITFFQEVVQIGYRST